MCAFEFLHFLPMIMIAASFIASRFGFNLTASYAAIFLTSLTGLFAGEHMHAVHFEPLAALDPCYFYVATAFASSVALISNALKSQKAKA